MGLEGQPGFEQDVELWNAKAAQALRELEAVPARHWEAIEPALRVLRELTAELAAKLRLDSARSEEAGPASS